MDSISPTYSVGKNPTKNPRSKNHLEDHTGPANPSLGVVFGNMVYLPTLG